MQNTFCRCEKKYLITLEQAASFQDILSEYMMPDHFGEYLVQNLYFDTENWDVIRSSIENPVYKEKLRLRCYGALVKDSRLFLELKKKCEGIVYKRRIIVEKKHIPTITTQDIVASTSSQISRELDFYIKSNAVHEKIYISYKRSAFAGKKDEGLRVTFDTDMRFRLDCLDFSHPSRGSNIISCGKVLMEIKTPDAIPLWMTHALSENKIFPTGFSKYGVCYVNHILKKSKIEQGEKISA